MAPDRVPPARVHLGLALGPSKRCPAVDRAPADHAWGSRSLAAEGPTSEALQLTPVSPCQLYSSWNSLSKMWEERQNHLEDQLQALVMRQETREVRSSSCLETSVHCQGQACPEGDCPGLAGMGFCGLLLWAWESGDQREAFWGPPGRERGEMAKGEPESMPSLHPSGAPLRLLSSPDPPLQARSFLAGGLRPSLPVSALSFSQTHRASLPPHLFDLPDPKP